MKLEQFHTAAMMNAENYFYKHGNLPATLIALQPNNEIFLCCRGFESQDEKAFVFDLYAGILKAKKSIMYSFISESWFYQTKDLKDYIAPSQHPDKKECIIITTFTKNNRHLFHCYEIKRNENIILQPLNNDDLKDISGSGATLFNRLDRYNSDHINGMITELKLLTPLLTECNWYFDLDVDKYIKGSLHD